MPGGLSQPPAPVSHERSPSVPSPATRGQRPRRDDEPRPRSAQTHASPRDQSPRGSSGAGLGGPALASPPPAAPSPSAAPHPAGAALLAAGGQTPRLAGLSGDHRSSSPPGPECWVQMGHLGQRRDCDGSSTRPWAADSPVPHPRPHRLRPGLKAFGRRSPQSREQRAGDAYPWASASGSIPHSVQTDTSGLGSFTEPGGDRDGPQTAAAERRHSGPRFTRPPGLVRC